MLVFVDFLNLFYQENVIWSEKNTNKFALIKFTAILTSFNYRISPFLCPSNTYDLILAALMQMWGRMSSRDVQNFETGRISALRDERVYIQKKTFTKWANAFLEKVITLSSQMSEIIKLFWIHTRFRDLSDWQVLMQNSFLTIQMSEVWVRKIIHNLGASCLRFVFWSEKIFIVLGSRFARSICEFMILQV